MKKLLTPLLLAMSLTACQHLPQKSTSDTWQKATLLNSQEQILHSSHTDKDYLIQVATIGDMPKNGYPVIYVLDGNAFFPVASSMMQMIHGRPNHTPKSFMVVGIGYTTGKQFDIPNRTHDLTLPSASYPTPKGEQTKFGGAEDFGQFFEQELKPALAQKWHINPNHQSLFGHSYGGLFTLYTLLNHPQRFHNYLIASPSIWWNDERIKQDFAKLSPTPNIDNVLITLGEYELKNGEKDRPNRQEHLQTRNMGNAGELFDFIKTTLPNTQVSFTLNAKHAHGMNAFPSLLESMNLVYQLCQDDKEC